jgi:ferredoxin/coenzyme F420-reducing hydrogenase delta subunit
MAAAPVPWARSPEALDEVLMSVNPAEAGLPGSGPIARAFRRVERAADRVFGEHDNPLRQLGGLGFYLFWLISVTGIYLYVFYETSVDGAHASVERMTHEQWWAGGVMRSLHRYASDAFVAVIGLHLLRELAYGRFRGFRWYSWISGVPTLWLAIASGVVGYWLVWDSVAQFVAIATAEWFGVLPGFGPDLVRNFIEAQAVSDRLFSLLIFLHIGLPLVLLLVMWAHLQRLTRPRTNTSRAVAAWTLAALTAASFVAPALSEPPADLQRVAAVVPIDWFYLAPLPAIYATSPEAVWIMSIAATLLLAALPWLSRQPRPAPAIVDPAHCNGCTRCFADCPYAAIAMAPHPDGRGQIAVVDEDRCAACGICSGACPSAMPFRSGERLVSGIDLPWLTVGDLRDRLDAAIAGAAPSAGAPIVVFACQRGAGLDAEAPAGVIGLGMPCAGFLPPSFVDYSLRSGARGVVVAACPGDDCEYRFGERWTVERLAGSREPRLRASADARRLLVLHAAREDRAALNAGIDEFRAKLERLEPANAKETAND